MKIKPFKPLDPSLVLTVFALVGLGVVMVLSASSALALQRYGDSYHFLKRQTFSAGIGILGLLLLSQIPYEYHRKLVYPALISALALMVMVLFPGIGYEVGGARRWLRLGGFSFQPSELAKIAFTVYLAYSLTKKGEKVREFSIGFLPHLIFLGLFVLVALLQKDLGTVVVLGLLTFAMLFIGGARTLHLFATGTAALGLLALAIVMEPYRLKRVFVYLNPWADPLDHGFQIIHSFLALGSGGIFGVGIGDGKQKLFYLPEPHTDFIFSVLGEELGLVGVSAAVALYVVLFWRGIQISRKALDPFGSLLAFGLTLLISFQVIMNIWVVMGLVPTKGMALPFMSYGGSALMMNLCVVGVLLSIRSKGRAS
ncbi:MAG: putative lipid II flippase FtsW [Deltaproteobacteria bacterium]|nr:putative lipid II flippase FtsW [Deltaproteobacteria bacterium]